MQQEVKPFAGSNFIKVNKKERSCCSSLKWACFLKLLLFLAAQIELICAVIHAPSISIQFFATSLLQISQPAKRMLCI